MRSATEGLELPPDFSPNVLEGVRRRRTRRRITAVTTAVAASVVAVTAGVLALPDEQPNKDEVGVISVRPEMQECGTADDQPAEQQTGTTAERMQAPTKGDLAGDEAFLSEVATAWRTGLSVAPLAAAGYYDDRRGDPHVYWAGNTPAGRAAIVLQEIQVPDNDQLPAGEAGPRTVEGLVAIDPSDGKLRLVSTRVPGEGQLGMADFYKFGANDQTMLIVDEGKPLHYTHEFAHPSLVTGDMTPEIEWHPVQANDGVALVNIPPEKVFPTVAYQGDQPPNAIDWTTLSSDFFANRVATATRFLAARLANPDFRTSFLPWTDTWQVGTPLHLPPAQCVASLRSILENPVLPTPDYKGQWGILAALPDGRQVALREHQQRDGKPQLVGVISTKDLGGGESMAGLVDGGEIDRNAVLPVKYHVPDGGGWIVAKKGQTLSYRTTKDEQWLDAGKDAALLPDNAIEVKVGDDVVTL